MDHFHPFKRSLVVLTMLGVVGCSTTSDADYQQTAEASRAALHAWQYAQTDAVALNQLTDLIEIPQLTDLVQQAMQQNPGLQQTAIALQIAYAQRGVSASARMPQLAAGFNGSRAEDNDASYSADLTVSWEVDLWQKLSDNLLAAEMDIAGSQASYQGARDALAANIMRSWLQINLQQQLIAIENDRLHTLENNEGFILGRYRSGLGTLEALDSARSSSAKTRATVAEYQELLAQQQRTLQLLLGGSLLGRSSGQASAASNQLQPVVTAVAFPVVLQPLAGLPTQDLGRRPDLQGAYYKIIAEQHRTDVAYKALLPSISLSASLTDLASSPSSALFTSPAWSLLGQLTAPLFQGGKLRAQIDIAELTSEQSYWAYQESLLNAVNEVENTLGQEQSLDRQQLHLTTALASAKRSVTSYQTKYRQGLVDILDLLSVQQQTFDLQSQLTQVTYYRLVNRIDLGLALGLGVSQGEPS